MEVAPQNTNSTILAQLELANMSPEEQMDGLLLPQELTSAEFQNQAMAHAKGFLFTEGKYYCLNQESQSALNQKCTDYLSDVNKPKESKSLDMKDNIHHLSFKEKNIKEKELSSTKTEQTEAPRAELSRSKEKTAEKTQDFVQKKLSETQETTKPSVHMTLQKHLNKESSLFSNHMSKRQENSEEKKEMRSKEKPHFERKDKEAEIKDGEKHLVERRQEKEKEKEKEKNDGQGFQEDQKKNKDEQDSHKEENHLSVKKATFETEFIHYSNQDSIVSELLKMKTSQFDVILLFLEIMKLAIKSREQERLSRWQERELQLYHMQKVVENFKQQGKYQLIAGIGSGVFAIVSGLCPILGHLKGDWIKDKLSYVMTSMKDMETDKLFKSLTKMTFAMSEMQKSTGQIQNTFAEGNRTFDQHMLEMHKTDADESTRTMDEIKDSWKSIENFVYQSLQMYHDAIRQLYQ